jgi:hypothetical protein
MPPTPAKSPPALLHESAARANGSAALARVVSEQRKYSCLLCSAFGFVSVLSIVTFITLLLTFNVSASALTDTELRRDVMAADIYGNAIAQIIESRMRVVQAASTYMQSRNWSTTDAGERVVDWRAYTASLAADSPEFVLDVVMADGNEFFCTPTLDDPSSTQSCYTLGPQGEWKTYFQQPLFMTKSGDSSYNGFETKAQRAATGAQGFEAVTNLTRRWNGLETRSQSYGTSANAMYTTSISLDREIHVGIPLVSRMGTGTDGGFVATELPLHVLSRALFNTLRHVDALLQGSRSIAVLVDNAGFLLAAPVPVYSYANLTATFAALVAKGFRCAQPSDDGLWPPTTYNNRGVVNTCRPHVADLDSGFGTAVVTDAVAAALARSDAKPYVSGTTDEYVMLAARIRGWGNATALMKNTVLMVRVTRASYRLDSFHRVSSIVIGIVISITVALLMLTGACSLRHHREVRLMVQEQDMGIDGGLSTPGRGGIKKHPGSPLRHHSDHSPPRAALDDIMNTNVGLVVGRRAEFDTPDGGAMSTRTASPLEPQREMTSVGDGGGLSMADAITLCNFLPPPLAAVAFDNLGAFSGFTQVTSLLSDTSMMDAAANPQAAVDAARRLVRIGTVQRNVTLVWMLDVNPGVDPVAHTAKESERTLLLQSLTTRYGGFVIVQQGVVTLVAFNAISHVVEHPKAGVDFALAAVRSWPTFSVGIASGRVMSGVSGVASHGYRIAVVGPPLRISVTLGDLTSLFDATVLLHGATARMLVATGHPRGFRLLARALVRLPGEPGIVVVYEMPVHAQRMDESHADEHSDANSLHATTTFMNEVFPKGFRDEPAPQLSWPRSLSYCSAAEVVDWTCVAECINSAYEEAAVRCYKNMRLAYRLAAEAAAAMSRSSGGSSDAAPTDSWRASVQAALKRLEALKEATIGLEDEVSDPPVETFGRYYDAITRRAIPGPRDNSA